TYKDKLIPVNTADISCFYTTDKITQVVMRDGTTYPYAKTLEQIITALDPSLFMRANKQYVLSRNCIREITVWFDSRLRVSIDVKVPEQIFISKNKAAEFKAWIVNEDIE
ncbi:MAG: LytTR family transcriptional regulator, partial [Alistipes sp.]|nr:LytTR family transcriptional regulator [Alistipes sp.]